jgi:tight adherence protein B
MTALAAILGAGAGLGLVMIIGGCRRSDGDFHRRHAAFSRIRRERLAIKLAISVGAAVLIGAITGWPVAALLAGAGTLTVPKLLGGSRNRARQVARTEAVAGWTEMLRDTLSAAAGLEQAIAATAAVSPIPIRPQVMALATALDSERLVPALRNFANELADPTGDLVVAALVLAAGHEARKLSDLLGSLAAAARDQAAMQLRIEAGRARIRTSTNVVVGSTLFFALGLLVLNRSYLHPFGTALGEAVLAIIGVIFGFSFWWLERMGRPHSPERFLASVARPTPDQSSSHTERFL